MVECGQRIRDIKHNIVRCDYCNKEGYYEDMILTPDYKFCSKRCNNKFVNSNLYLLFLFGVILAILAGIITTLTLYFKGG